MAAMPSSMTFQAKCPECDHTEPVAVQLHVGGGDGRTINVTPEVTDEALAEVVRRFEVHAETAH